MTRAVKTILAWAMLAAGALVFASAAPAGEIRSGLTFQSDALKGPMRYSLYLPDGYEEAPGKRFPVVYLLHGYGANDREWVQLGNVDAILDRMIRARQIPPIVAVMPFAAKSWYVDSAALGGPGDYETAIVRDLMAHVESRYRVVAQRKGRVIAGLSMGGYGALRLAFFHPRRFAAAASLSGALYRDVGIPGVEGPIEEAGDKAKQWYRGAYGRPFDPAIYRERNPFSRIPALSRMTTPPKILITSGDDDYFDFYEGSAALFIALRRAGIAAELRIDDGGHDWDLWRSQFPQVIRFLSAAMK